MKLIYLFTVIFMCQSCSSIHTMKAISESPEQLHQKIQNGELLQKGDRIKLTRIDGKRITMTVDSLDTKNIYYGKESIAINDILTLQKESIDSVKTTLSVVAIVSFIILISTLGASF